MAVFSVLRATSGTLRSLKAPILKSSLALVPKQNAQQVLQREMSGHGHKMALRPSQYEWRKWKDDFHFFIALGLIPMGILITGVNVFVGKAELADIPEDYDPKPWEYHKHPICRWFARYVYDPPEKCYEKMLHHLNEEHQKAKYRGLEKKVKLLMSERGDYKGWYYIPVNDRHTYRAREQIEEMEASRGSGPV